MGKEKEEEERRRRGTHHNGDALRKSVTDPSAPLIPLMSASLSLEWGWEEKEEEFTLIGMLLGSK